MHKEREDIIWGIGFWALFLGALFLLNASVVTYEAVKYPDQVLAATTSAVAVTATVAQNITCSSNVSSTAFGTLSAGTIASSTPNASTTMSCGNVPGGCTLTVKDAGNGVNGGLATTSPAYLIPSPNAAFNATATLSGSAEGYGIQAATTTAGSGQAFTIGARYLQTGNTVGGLSISAITIAQTTATSSNREILTTHAAVIISTTQAGSYTDTITYECTAT